MNILHEVNQLEFGGAERVILGIVKHDKTNKHIVFSYKDGAMKEALEKAGAEVLIDAKEELNVNCDIIHIHTGGAESHIASVVKGSIPTIETIHSPVVSRVRPDYTIQKIGVTNQVTKLNRNCKTIYNGIDFERLEIGTTERNLRDELGIPKDAFVIGRLGRLGYDKNIEEFLIACHSFQKQYPDTHILIVGDEAINAQGYLAKLKIHCVSLPIKNYHFVDAMENVGVAYEAMDVFLYPSLTEGFCLVIMEAMASYLPVITWKTPVMNELLTGYGLLTENNIDSLVHALRVLYFSEPLRNEFGAYGHDLVLSEFTDERMSIDYQNLYDEIYRKHCQKHVA